MILLSKQEVLNNKDFYIDEIKNGKVFIYPTDTLFGLGVDATNKDGVERIFQIKNREAKPLLVIIPSWQWLKTNCTISKENYASIKQKLPGAYSFIINLKNKTAICEKVNSGQDSLGIRIPDCWFTELIQKAKVPFVTTSVNLSGQAPAIKISDMTKEVLEAVDYVIDDETPLSGKASTIIDLRGEEKVLR